MENAKIAAEAAQFPTPVRASTAEVELHTALTLARASTQALLNLSPLAHREICDALADEVASLRRQGDARSLATAQAVERYLARAA